MGVRLEDKGAGQTVLVYVVTNMAGAAGSNASSRFLDVEAGIYDHTTLRGLVGNHVAKCRALFVEEHLNVWCVFGFWILYAHFVVAHVAQASGLVYSEII